MKALLMRKVLRSFAFIAVLIFTVSAAVSVAVAQSDFDEAKWTKFENKLEEFTVNFPTAKVNGVARSSAEQMSAKYVAAHNKTFFAAFSDRSAAASPFEKVKSIIAPENTLPKEIEIDGLKAKRYEFRGSDDYEHSVVIVQTPLHYYVFHVISETRDNSLIEEFLGSIKFENNIDAAAGEVKPDATQPTPSAPNTASGDLSSAFKTPPSSSGIPPRGSLPEASVAPPKYSRVDSPVTILLKPKPTYPELARLYMIDGMVKLRVTFEKDSQIGEIRVLNKLPLGMTQNAMSAARDIRFSPALRIGQPYATTRVMEYPFSLN